MATLNLPTGYEARMSLKSSFTQEARLRQLEFGDGYIQRTPLGLNNLKRRLNVSWENLTQSEYTTLMSTLNLVQQYGDAIALSSSYFLTSAGEFMIESLDVQLGDNDHFTVSAGLTEVFDL